MALTPTTMTIADNATTPVVHPLRTFKDATNAEFSGHVPTVDDGAGNQVPVTKARPLPVGTGLLVPALVIQKSSSAITYSSTRLIVGGGAGGFVPTANPFTVGQQYRLTDCKLVSNKNNGALGTTAASFSVYFANGTYVGASGIADGAALATNQFTGGGATIGRCDVVIDTNDPFSDTKVGFGGTGMVVANVFTATSPTISAFLITLATGYPSMANETFTIIPTFEVLN